MNFKYHQEWTLESSEVARIDASRARLNDLFARYQGQFIGGVCPSLTTLNRLKQHAAQLRGRIRRCPRERLSQFDRIVLMDAARNVEKIEGYTKWFDSPNGTSGSNGKNTVGYLLNVLYGPPSYTFLQRSEQKESSSNRRGYPHKTVDEYNRLTTKRDMKTLDLEYLDTSRSSLSPELRGVIGELKRFLKTYPEKLKRDIQSILIEMNMLKGGSKLEGSIRIGKSMYGLAGMFDPPFDVATIGEDTISITRERDGPPKIYTGYALLTGFHEVAAHFLQKRMSGGLPEGLQHIKRDWSDPIHGDCIEGASRMMEGFLVEIVSKNPEKFELTQQEARIVRLSLEHDRALQIISAACGLRRLDALRESMKEHLKSGKRVPETFKSKEEVVDLSKRTGFERFLKDPDCVGTVMPASEIFSTLSYLFGDRRYRGLVTRLRRNKVPLEIVASALLTGVWTSKAAQERFIRELYIPWAMQQR